MDARLERRAHSFDRRRPARAGAEAGGRPPLVLLARDVRAPGDERPQRGHVVSRRTRPDLFHAGLALAPADRLGRGGRGHRRRRVRLSARLVSGRTLRRVRPLREGRHRAGAPGPGDGGGAARDSEWGGERRAALVARRRPHRVRLHRVQRTLAHLRVVGRRRQAGRRDAAHRGQRQQVAPLLLQYVGSISLSHLVARREGAAPRLEPWAYPRQRRPLADAGDAGCAVARDPLRGDHLEGAAGLVPRRDPRRLQLLPRPAVESAVAHDQRGGRRVSAHLRRVRCHGAALVARRQADRVHLERRWQHLALGDRRAGGTAAADPRHSASLPRAGRTAPRGGRRSCRASTPRPHLGHAARRAGVRTRRCLAPRR